MTNNQRIALQADWWPAACRAQGWKASDRALRLRVCSWAVSLENPTQLMLLDAINSDRTPVRALESTSDLDNKADVDRVKACLGMLADSVKLTGEVGQPQFGSARRKRDVIRSQIKCLALFEAQPKRYVATLIQDMFAAKLGGDVTIKELTDVSPGKFPNGGERPSDLNRLLMRLSQIVNDKRNQNELQPAYKQLQGTQPLTIHEMKITAGVVCDCKYCTSLRARPGAPLLPPLPVEENWSDFDPELDPAGVADCELGSAPSEQGENPF
jgi:hypothetical protein